MPEVSSLFSGIQIGAETTPGTGVAAGKLLNYLSFTPTFWAGDFKTETPMGQKAASGVAPGYDYTSWAVDSTVGSFSEFIYPYCGLFTNVTPTTVDTSAKLWTFIPTGRSEDTIKTFTVESGSATRAQKATYLLFTGIEHTFNRDTGLATTGTAIAQNIQDNITLTAAPTALEIQPVDPPFLNVYLDSTSANVGTTKLTRDFNAVFRYQNARNPVWPINSANASFASHVETLPTCEIELTVEADTQGMSMLPIARASTLQYIRLEAKSTVLAGAATAFYQLQIDMAGEVTAIAGPTDTDGIKTVTYTFTGVYDPAWGTGQYLKVGYQNKTTSL